MGEYAAGKSENAVNRALGLVRMNRKVRLVDLDLVEPFYTLRPIQDSLRREGMEVIARRTAESAGLGETGGILTRETAGSLHFPGDVILDVGYGSHGVKTLKLVHGALDPGAITVCMVVNGMRPLTSTVELIVDYVRDFGRVDGLINNTHLGDETTVELVQEGARLAARAAGILGIPVLATSAVEAVAAKIGPADIMGNPVRPLKRWMPDAVW